MTLSELELATKTLVSDMQTLIDTFHATNADAKITSLTSLREGSPEGILTKVALVTEANLDGVTVRMEVPARAAL